jgi:membrane dipeptidase
VKDFERVAEVARGEGILVQEAGRPGLLGTGDIRVLVRARVDDDVLGRVQRANQTGRLEAVATGHCEVHHHDVGPVLACKLDCLVACSSPPDLREALVFAQQRFDQLGEPIIVFRNDHAQRGDLHARERDTSRPYHAPVILDGHNDLVLRAWQGETPRHIHLATAAATGFAGGFFALYVPGAERLVEPRRAPYALPLDDPIPTEEAARIADELAVILEGFGLPLARRASDFVPGQITAIMHLEGADPLAPDLSDLELWYERGLRSIGIVWSRPNVFAAGVPFRFPSSPDTGPGLTDAGRRLVHACNRLGILVDLSHLNEAGFWDVASLALAPLVATHSNAHALSASTRNLTDDQLEAIGKSGGVVGINFGVAFLRADGTNDPATPIETIVHHVEYIASRIGVDHVAFGSDFEGATLPDELGGAAGLPRLVELLRARFGDEDMAKITHGNWLRVLDQTWRPWGRYFAAAGDEPRPTLLDALARFSAPGLAVDLGCGTGRDTAELLRRGWRVIAIDREPEALERLHTLAGPDSAQLEARLARFEEAAWPACDLINSSFALPFCPPESFPAVWRRIVESLPPGGRFCGQLFGERDDWAGSGVLVHTRAEIDELLAPFEVELLDVFDDEGTTVVGTRKHWHLYHLVARKL